MWRPRFWESSPTHGKFHVLYGGRTVGYLDMDFLHGGLPKMGLNAACKPKSFKEPQLPMPNDLAETLQQMLFRFNICSKESIIRQYDHEVQGGSVVKLLVGKENDGPSDAAIILPILDSREGVVVSNGISPRYSDIDTYHMMACSIDEALRNNVAVGGRIDRIVGLDNLCWPDPIQSDKTPYGDINCLNSSGPIRPSMTLPPPSAFPAFQAKTA